MAFSETPVYPGKMISGQATLAASSAATTTIFTADATYGAIIRGPLILYEKGTGGARTCRLELKEGSTTTVLKRFATSGTQYTSTNIFSSTYIPGLDSTDPELRLKPGQTLQITTEDTNNNAVDVSVLNAMSYEYPN